MSEEQSQSALEIIRLTRRDLLRLGVGSAAAGTGLILGIVSAEAQASKAGRKPAPGKMPQITRPAASYTLNAFVSVGTDGIVTVWAPQAEFGQGIHTLLAMLVAEEMEADWSRVRAVQAPFGPQYGNQDALSDEGVRQTWLLMRGVGGSARAMLIDAAAKQWGVDPSSCMARSGFVLHSGSNRKLSFGELAAAAAKTPSNRSIRVKPDSEFRIIGKPVHRVDTPQKVDGSADFGLDIKVPGMLYAAIARSPVFGSAPASVDSAKAAKSAGVKKVVTLANKSVAVVGTSTWSAIQGRESLKITWAESPANKASSVELRSQMNEAAQKPGASVRKTGQPESAPPELKRLEASYETPFQAHAQMEPMNCTASVTNDRCEIWAPVQFPSVAVKEAQRITGLPAEKITLHIPYLGGAFGRGVTPDAVIEAVEVSKATGAPVKVVRTREDDIQHDFYRPMSFHKLQGALDADGWPIAWQHHVVTNSPPDGPPQVDVGGAADIPYQIPNVGVSHSTIPFHVPRGWWRSGDHSFNAFAVECFLDELATLGGKDPVQLRLRLLNDSRLVESASGTKIDTGRLKRVVELAAEKAGWSTALPARSGRGVACHASFGSYVAHVAEVAVGKDGDVKVTRVVCAVDAGLPVNPNIIEAQMQGSVAFGLGAALKGAITIENGQVAQANFHNYPMLHINEMPRVEVHIVPSAEVPGGVGESGVPSVAPALCNALFAATGVRIRALPVRTRLLRQR